jgi:heat shock protein HslJ
MKTTTSAMTMVILILGLLGCGQGPADEDTKNALIAVTRAAGPPSVIELRSATLRGFSGEAITLENGRWEGEPSAPDSASRPVVSLVGDFSLFGDLNGDGVDEATVLLSSTDGGSGSFLHLGVMARQGHEVVNLATALLGDRVMVRSGSVAGGVLSLHVVQHGETDPACCPGELFTRSWQLTGDELVEVEAVATGRLSLETLSEKAWLLESLSETDVAPEYPQITLFFQDGRAQGSSGCNQYTGNAKPGANPASLKLGPFAVTRMACPDPMMELENRYMAQLGGAQSFAFLPNKLVIVWKNRDTTGTMIFAAHELAEH